MPDTRERVRAALAARGSYALSDGDIDLILAALAEPSEKAVRAARLELEATIKWYVPNTVIRNTIRAALRVQLGLEGR